MRSWIAVVAFSGLLLHAGGAAADLITIEPDAFAPGSIISGGPGVSLWSISPIFGGATLSPVYATQDLSRAITGTQIFSATASGMLYGDASEATHCLQMANGVGQWSSCGANTTERGLLIAFDVAADVVSIGGAFGIDPTELIALDANFNWITSVRSGLGRIDQSGWYKTFTTITAPNMKYVIAGSDTGGIALDALTYHAVPEPSTLMYGLLGLAGLVRAVRSALRHAATPHLAQTARPLHENGTNRSKRQ